MPELDRHQIRALRNADTLVFYMNVARYQWDEPVHWIKAALNPENSSNGFEMYEAIPLDEPSVASYEDDSPTGSDHSHYPLSGVKTADMRGAVTVLNPKYNELARTWLYLVRPGDTLHLRLVLGSQSENLEEAGMVHDRAYLIIKRPTKRGSKRMVFALADDVLPAHSSARMVTRRH